MATLYKKAVVKYQANGDKEISYIKAGPSEGQLLIFLHGWPGIGYTWKNQIDMFSALGFLVVAPDSTEPLLDPSSDSHFTLLCWNFMSSSQRLDSSCGQKISY